MSGGVSLVKRVPLTEGLSGPFLPHILCFAREPDIPSSVGTEEDKINIAWKPLVESFVRENS